MTSSFVRTITLGIDPEAMPLRELEARAGAVYAAAEAKVAEAGRTLRTKRILLPALNGRPRFSRSSLQSVLQGVSEMAGRLGIRWFNVPFTTFVEGPLERHFEAALDVIRRHPTAFVNVAVARDGVINRPGIMAMARFVQDVSRLSANGYDNFRVGASCNCPAGAPFFPFTHHDGGPEMPIGFATAVELPELFHRVLDQHPGAALETIEDALLAELTAELVAVDQIALAIEAESGVPYRGLDASLAPFPNATGSVGQILERLGVELYGASGTLFVTSRLTRVLKRAVRESEVRAIGFHGVMDSLLEDPSLAASATQKTFGLDSLLAFAAVCGCGLDMVPIPGDTFVEEIAALILDVAALSTAANKPLGARLLPIPGKRANEMTDFAHDFFYNCRVLPVRNRSLVRETFE